MELVIVNQSSEKRWNRYRKDFLMIMERAKQFVSLDDEDVVSLIFVDPDEIHEINKSYRGIDRATDVISFALRDLEDEYETMGEEHELGDIFINIDAIVKQAHDYGHSLRREVCFLFTHGLLHLLGYDHMNEKDEKVMFNLQDVILDEIVPKKIRK